MVMKTPRPTPKRLSGVDKNAAKAGVVKKAKSVPKAANIIKNKVEKELKENKKVGKIKVENKNQKGNKKANNAAKESKEVDNKKRNENKKVDNKSKDTKAVDKKKQKGNKKVDKEPKEIKKVDQKEQVEPKKGKKKRQRGKKKGDKQLETQNKADDSISKKQKVNKKTEKKAGNASSKPLIEIKSDADQIDLQQIEQAIEALLKLISSKKESKKGDLFEETGQKVLVVVTAINLPKDKRSHQIKIWLPNDPVCKPYETCLFVADLERGLNVDHEPTVEHYKELLLKHKVADLVQEVIPLRELKTEYKQYEAKKRLSMRFDKYLAEEKVVKFLSDRNLLGKAFVAKRKFPIGVDLGSKSLRKTIEKALNTTILPLGNKGTCSSVNVGHTQMKPALLAENIKAVLDILAKKYPGGTRNVRSIYIRTDDSKAVPILFSDLSSKEVGRVKCNLPAPTLRPVVKGELSTMLSATVTVMPDGEVKVDRTKEEDNIEMEEDEEKVEKSKTKRKLKDKEEKKTKKSRKEEESEDEMEEVEQKYFRKMSSLQGEKEDEKEDKEKEDDDDEDEVQDENEDEEEDDEEDDDEEDDNQYDDQVEVEETLKDEDDDEEEEEEEEDELQLA